MTMTPSECAELTALTMCLRMQGGTCRCGFQATRALVWGDVLCDECKPSEGAIVDRELAHAKLARRFNKLLRGE
jgi:hypothetical protein